MVVENIGYTGLNKIDFSFLYVDTTMESLPVEILTLIAVDSFETFTTLLKIPTVGNRLCEYHPQQIARAKFMSVVNNKFQKRSYLNDMIHSFNDKPARIDYMTGNIYWYKYGKVHRDRDQPAVIFADETKHWYWNGERHRDCDLVPALVEYASGAKSWYWHDELHRMDKPAMINSSGDKSWYWHNKRHRENDQPALVEWINGKKSWYQYGKYIKSD